MNVQSSISTIDDFVNQELPSSNCCHHFEQQTTDDEKISESIVDPAGPLLTQGHLAQNKLTTLAKDATAPVTNAFDPIPPSTSSIVITEIDGTIPSGSAVPLTPSTTHKRERKTNVETNKKKHIMISYNQASASIVCKKIYDSLKACGFNVWFDQVDLHGSVLDSMGEAVDNAYILLLCINNGHSNSAFCRMEAKYATERRIPVIPCMMEEDFKPHGGLGIIKSDLKHIEFFYEDKFDESFEKLIEEIIHIEKKIDLQSGVTPVKQATTEQFTTLTTISPCSSNDTKFCERFNAIIYFGKILLKLIQEFSPETFQSFLKQQFDGVDSREQQENDCLIQHLLQHNEQLKEVIRNQQENNVHIQQYLVDQDERLAAFMRFQQKQEQENAHCSHRHNNQSEQLQSIVHLQREQHHDNIYLQQQIFHQNDQLTHISHRQQEQERNHHISDKLLQHVEQLTQLVVDQQQQHARNTETLHQLMNRSLDKNESLESTMNENLILRDIQERAGIRFNFDTFNKLVQTIVLLWILIVILRDE
ncbi:unnamed protein product [Rotaria sp. Silwood2]|nr:unnamed protein product [Rotaria sp. Silwood2]